MGETAERADLRPFLAREARFFQGEKLYTSGLDSAFLHLDKDGTAEM